ncbi:MAG: MATE family efflux transporter [Clostridia bacterium]|nr:MATE family efflux transporter [Clostridia bacterium]
MKKARNEINMTEGPILGKMLAFAFPLMFSGLLQLLFNAADIVVVGKFAGDLCLAAVGSNGPLVHLIVTLFIGLSVGTNVIVAKYIGAKKYKEVEETVHTSMALALVSGVGLTILGMIVSGPLLVMMQTPEKVLPLATTYLRIYFVSMPAMMVYNFGAAILRANGDTRRPLIFLTISGIVNVVLNLYFVIVLKIDVRGVGWATAISQYVSAVLIFVSLVREKSSIRLVLKDIRICSEKAVSIIKIGVPAGIQGMMFSISNILIQSSINSFGDVAMAGNSAAGNIEGFIFTGINAFSQAGMSFTSQNVGAGKNERIRPIMTRTMLTTTAAGIIFGGGVYLFGETLLSFYTNTPETIAYGMIRVTYVCLPYLLDGWMDAVSALTRGLGFSLPPMIITMVGVCLFRVLWLSTVFQIPKFHTLECIYLSYTTSWIITTVAEVICYIVIMKKHFKVETKQNV